MTKMIFLLAVLCLAGCQQPAPKTDNTADLQALKETASLYNAKGESSSFDELKAFYSSNARVMPPSEETIQGAEGIGNFYDSFKTLKNFKADFSEPEVVIASSGDIGYSLSTGTLSWEDETGNVTTETIRDFHVWVKQADSSWKMELDIWNEMKP